jgi:hypothetical protein
MQTASFDFTIEDMVVRWKSRYQRLTRPFGAIHQRSVTIQ